MYTVYSLNFPNGKEYLLLQDAADDFAVDKRIIHSLLKYPNRHKMLARKYTFKYVEEKVG